MLVSRGQNVHQVSTSFAMATLLIIAFVKPASPDSQTEPTFMLVIHGQNVRQANAHPALAMLPTTGNASHAPTEIPT